MQQLWQIGATTANAVTNLAATSTAGFRNTKVADVTAAAASASVALDNADAADGLKIDGDALSTVNVSGTTEKNASGDATVLKLTVKAGKDVETLTVNSTVAAGTTLDLKETNSGSGSVATVNLKLTGDTSVDASDLNALKTVDASASTGAITLKNTEDTVSTIKTGAGNDDVELKTALSSTVKAASVSTGAGDDIINVNVSGSGTGLTVTVDAGAGNDTITVTGRGAAALAINAGAGDDVVDLTGLTLTTADVINGGEGSDTVIVSAKDTVRTADDFLILNNLLTGFETIKFVGDDEGNYDGDEVGVDALDLSKLAARYTTVEFEYDANVKNVGTQKLIINEDLRAWAAGYKAEEGKDTVYAGTLNIVVQDYDDADVTAYANSVNLTVDASNDNAVVTLDGDLKSASVILVQKLNEEGDAYVGDAEFKLTTFAGNDVDGPVLAELTTLTLSGNGSATVTNGAGTKLVTVNASALNSTEADGSIADGLTYTSNNALAETITLGAGKDTITLNASTVDATDTIVGFSVVKEAGALVAAKSDVLSIDGVVGNQLVKFTTTQTSLELALLDAARYAVDGADKNTLAFQFGNDTYVFVDTDGNGNAANNTVDGGDILVKLVGVNVDDFLALTAA